MLTAETVHAEGARYAACLVLVPGLWAGPEVWRGCAGFLGHRGWECHLLDLRGLAGGLEARAAAIADYTAALPAPAVLVGHDAGGLAALLAARRTSAAALVLLAPLAPGSRAARALVRSPSRLLALVRGRPVPPPAGRGAVLLAGGLPEPLRASVLGGLAAEDPAVVRDVAWGRVALAPAVGVPTLLVAGEHDPLLPPAAAAALARTLAAEQSVLSAAGHWPLAGPRWQPAVDLVHRWIVRRLGAPLLELYTEAMAERDGEDGAQ